MQQPTLPLSQQPFVLGKWMGLAVIAAVLSYAFDAPARFALTKVHLSPLIYLRDAVAVMVMIAALMHWITGRRQNPVIIMTLVLFLHVCLGVLILGSVVAPAMGFKPYLPFLMGVACYGSLQHNEKFFYKLVLIVFYVSSVGIFINWATDMPWTGEFVDTAAGAVTASREWTSGGVRRLAGFARDSAAASAVVATTCAAILAARTSLLHRLLVITIAFISILLTTSKGSVLAMVFIALFGLLSGRKKANTLNPIFFVAPAVGIIIPAFVYLSDAKLDINNGIWVIFSSFADRINNTWPQAFELLKRSGNPILGRGLGGIGFSQYFAENAYYNPGDNAMLSLYISMGAASIFYIYIITIRLKEKSSDISQYIWKCIIGWLIYWHIYGITANTIEIPFYAFFAGLIVGAAFHTSAYIAYKKPIPIAMESC